MSEHDAEQRAIRQLRTELANARGCDDAYVEVMTDADQGAELGAADLINLPHMAIVTDRQGYAWQISRLRSIVAMRANGGNVLLPKEQDLLERYAPFRLATSTRQAERIRELGANRNGWRRAFREVHAERNQALSDLIGANEQLDHLAERVKELEGERDRALRIIEVADDSICMCVFAARAVVRNEEAAAATTDGSET